MNPVLLTLVPTPFTPGPSDTVEQFHQNVVTSIAGATTDSEVITGQIGGSAPTLDIGPWLKDGNTWWAWNSTEYVPMLIKVGNKDYQVTLDTQALSANRTHTLQDKDGIIALTGDITGGRTAVTLAAGATPDINWSASNNFSLKLLQSITISNSNSLPGQEIGVALYNTNDWTVTWPADVHWGEGGTPVQTLDRGVSFSDGSITNTDATLTGPTAKFSLADIGATVAATGIPAATTIISINSPTSVEMSANATATTTGTLAFTITGDRGSTDVYVLKNIGGAIYGNRRITGA